MKRIKITIYLLLFVCLSIFGQQPKIVSIQGQPQKTSTQVTTNQQESIKQLQAENEAMKAQLDRMEKEIELYRGDVRAKIAEIDEGQSRWLTLLAIIMGLIGAVLGVGAPYFINKDNSKRVETRFSEMKDDLREQVRLATSQANTATGQANKAKEAFEQIRPQVETTIKQAEIAAQQAKDAKQSVEDIESLKTQVSEIQQKINADTIAAEKAAKEAKASQLFTEALAEHDKNPVRAIELYTQAIQ